VSSRPAFPEVAKETHDETRGRSSGQKLRQETASCPPSCRPWIRVQWREPSGLVMVTVLHTSASRSFCEIRASLH